MESRRIIFFLFLFSFFLSFFYSALADGMREREANYREILERFLIGLAFFSFPFLFFFFFSLKALLSRLRTSLRPIRKITRSTTTDDWARLRQRGHAPVVVALVSLRMSHSTGNQHHGHTIFFSMSL